MTMEDEKKYYMIDLSMEVMTEDNETVKAIHIHGIKNDPVPLSLWCDFLERLGRMTPDEMVMFVTGERCRPLVEKDKGYIITDYYRDFIPGDIFKGVGDYELQHCRSGEIVTVEREMMESLFKCVGEFDASWADVISPENMEMVEKIKNMADEMKCINNIELNYGTTKEHQ